MHDRWRQRSVVGALAGITLLVLSAAPVAAHEERDVGPQLLMAVGFGSEPAYAGQPNSVQVLLHRDGKPIVDLGDTLEVEVAFGDQSTKLPLEPFFEEAEFGTLGDYRAWFIPTRPGRYAFHFTGTVDGQMVDETFASGPGTFDDVQDPRSAEFPLQDPSTGELADRIDREVPRLTASIDQARAAAVERAQSAADDASNAKRLGAIGLIVGALGLIVAIVALGSTRRERA